MNKANIDWFILDSDEYIQDTELYLGSFTSDSSIEIIIQIWNNRYGLEEVESIENARLSMKFDSFEDSTLFNYCSVKVNNSDVDLDLIANKAIINIGSLSGQINDGIDNAGNRDNYKDIIIKFSNFPSSLKNGLKNLYLNIEND